MLAVALLVWFGPPAASPTEPAPPNSVVARNDPPTSPDQPREDPEPEPLRFDDPMFAALDRGVDTEPVSDRWSIGSYLRGELPGGL